MSNQQDHPPPTAPVSLVRLDEGQDSTTLARQALRTTAPGTEMSAVLELEPGDLEQRRRMVANGVEELTGLRLGELQSLAAVAEGADHHRTVARLTGQADAAAAATVAGLVRKGLLGQHHHPSEPNTSAEPTLVHLTPQGDAVLGQSEAIRIRLLDTLAQSLSEEELAQLRGAAGTLGLGQRIEDVRRQIGGSPAAS